MRLLRVSRGAVIGFCGVIFSVVVFVAPAAAETYRIVTYNVEADTDGFTGPRPGMDTVLQGIGDEVVNGAARPIDILTLQETTSNTATVDPIVTMLNHIYGCDLPCPPIYARSPYQAIDNCDSCVGNGPNAIVYNQQRLSLIASVGIGQPSSSGPPRQPVRYQFRPAGGISAQDFYVYVSHMKSGTSTSDLNRRNVEAQSYLRASAVSLPSTARIIYTGDFNWGSSFESAYVTLTQAFPGTGQAFDPLNRPGNWQNNSAFKDILTESATSLRYRDDCQLVTQIVLNDSSGLQYIPGSYHTFGVNGTTPVGGTVNSPSNTALPGLPNRSAVLSALTTASDHLPMVADYSLTISQAPVVIGQPVDQSACTNGSTSFSVVASGVPAPTYQWRRGTSNLSDGGTVSGSATPTLSVSPIGLSDAGTDYNCLVSNTAGSVASNNAALNVFQGGSGDVNGDGFVDGLDIQPFLDAIFSGGPAGSSYCSADINQDGTANTADVDGFVNLLLGP